MTAGRVSFRLLQKLRTILATGFQALNSVSDQNPTRRCFARSLGCLRALKGTATTDHVIWRLNLIITGCRFENRSVGWVFFFRQVSDMAQFHRMDVFVRKELGIYGLKHEKSSAKGFVKACREIKYNRADTKYKHDFDNSRLADKIHVIALMRGLSPKKLGRMERTEIDELKWSIVPRQVAEMEREPVDYRR